MFASLIPFFGEGTKHVFQKSLPFFPTDSLNNLENPTFYHSNKTLKTIMNVAISSKNSN